MKSDGMLSTLTFSLKRKDILFFLQEGSHTLQEINSNFHIHSTESLPRLREMEAANLVIKNGDRYELTWIGDIGCIWKYH